MKSISDAELFSKVPFAFEQCGEQFCGSILLDGQEIQLDDLSGVLIRLSRKWSPPPDFDLQDHRTQKLYEAPKASLPMKLLDVHLTVEMRFA